MSAQVCSAIESMGKDVISAFYSGNYVDIFSFIDFGDPRSKYLEYSGIVGVEPYAHDVVFPIKPCRFEGQEFPCPHQVEAYLKHTYPKAATPGLPKLHAPLCFPLLPHCALSMGSLGADHHWNAKAQQFTSGSAGIAWNETSQRWVCPCLRDTPMAQCQVNCGQ